MMRVNHAVFAVRPVVERPGPAVQLGDQAGALRLSPVHHHAVALRDDFTL